jgi:histone-arginine methyltransferase CARM1
MGWLRFEPSSFLQEASGNHFVRKTDDGSAALYFHYYGMLQHQQNMLQDYVRTGAYFLAITDNPTDFAGKTIMDVGAGSGILSLFAAQVG